MRTAYEIRFWSRVDGSGGVNDCWEWTGCRLRNGYGRATDPRGFTTTAARVAYELVTGERPAPDMYLCHTCDNPPCCNPRHLFMGTPGQNSADAIRKGRLQSISNQHVAEMRALSASGMTGRELAARFGVSEATVSRALRGIGHSYQGATS